MFGFFLTLFPFLDVPVFWPILLLYWMVLFFITMKRQIKHMIRYKYVPFSFGKKVSMALSLYQIPCVYHLVVPVVHMGSGMLAMLPIMCS